MPFKQSKNIFRGKKTTKALALKEAVLKKVTIMLSVRKATAKMCTT